MGTAPVKAPAENFIAATAAGAVPDLGVRGALSDRRKFERIVTACEVCGDLITVTISVLASYWIYGVINVGQKPHYEPRDLVIGAIIFALLFVFLLDRDGTYSPATSLLGIRETERVMRASLYGFSVALCISFTSAHLLPLGILGCIAALVSISLVCEKQMIFHVVRNLHSHGYGTQRVVIYGAGNTGRRVFSALARSPKLGLKPLGIVDDSKQRVGERIFGLGYRREHSLQVSAGPITRQLLSEYDAGLLLIAIPSLTHEKRHQVATEAAAAGCAVAFVPQLSYASDTDKDHVDIDGVLVASFLAPVAKPVYDASKRLFDTAISIACLIATAPVWALIGILIRLDSPGPIFFRQTRIGRNGRPFRMFKFRSMGMNAPKYGYHPQQADDPRITRVGRWLRRTSLDELPQLLNVIKGDMSLVGPRPEMPFIVENYNDEQRQRLSVIPGITGLWQLSADRAFLIHENLQYDMYYIRNRNFFIDVALLLHTAMFAMRGV
jgi:exopolysaccharide biosynthesis polyprenyl glycosylphosphotransferase